MHLVKSSIERNNQIRRQSKDNPLSRNGTNNNRMLRFKRMKSVLFTDTMFSTKNKSAKVNKCFQVFVSENGHVAISPIFSQDDFELLYSGVAKKLALRSILF